MHTYQKTQKETADTLGLWTVMFITNDNKWSLKDFGKEEEAAQYASFLNGGLDPSQPWIRRGP